MKLNEIIENIESGWCVAKRPFLIGDIVRVIDEAMGFKVGDVVEILSFDEDDPMQLNCMAACYRAIDGYHDQIFTRRLELIS